MFLDGVGLGRPDARTNPFAVARTPTLDVLAGGDWLDPSPGADEARVFASVDACLDTDGLPQSATGQASLLTGRNAATVMGGHYGPWPGPTLRRVLDEGSLFSWAREVAGPGAPTAARLAGAYPPGFFEALRRGRMRLNAPAYAAQAAGAVLPDLAAFEAGEAVAADLDGAYFASLGVAPPGAAGAAAAGERLARIAAHATFTFFDVWPTDRAGHRADLDEAVALVERLDAFLGGLFDARPANVTVLLTSDHGNLEDLSSRRHTRAPVPLLAVGPGAGAFARARTIQDVAPAVRRLWRDGPKPLPAGSAAR